jgi:hypothetical protein
VTIEISDDRKIEQGNENTLENIKNNLAVYFIPADILQ